MSNGPDPFEEIAASLPTFEDDAEAVLTLRQQAMRDPVRGAPMNLAPAGEDEQMVEPGSWASEGFVDRRTGLPQNCPIAALGKLAETFYFLNTLGEVHTLAPNAGKGHIDALFAGRPLYLAWAWPRWSMPRSKTEQAKVTNWEAEVCRQALFAACAYKGTFELEDRVRGRGAWKDDHGSLIYHAGDAVFIQGRWRPPGEYGRYIYPGRPKIGRPSAKYEKAGDGSPGAVLLEGLQSWNWDRPKVDPKLALGWTMTAMIGGALEHRPIVYVVGNAGAGKTTLQKMLRWLMNGALVATSNTTQAGIYQKVRQDSIAAMVDEMEPKSDTRTTDKILELARIAFSGDKMQRGGKDGVGQEFAVMSSFMFSSIALPPMDTQDASRMAILMMRPRDKAAEGAAGVNVLKDLQLNDSRKLMALGQQLLRRAFKWFELKDGKSDWDRALAAFKDALLLSGHEDRSADCFSALAAGCHIALHDHLPTDAELVEWCELLFVRELAETADREQTWRQCFTHLLNTAPDAFRALKYASIGQLLEDWRTQKADTETVDIYLAKVGLAITWEKDVQGEPYDQARLYVPCNHPAVHDLFAETSWAGRKGVPGPWTGLLRQMPPELFEKGVCGKGLDRKQKGTLIYLAKALEA